MEEGPPAFQEAARCAVCDSAFSTFRRRHHCRCCGKSLCNEHSSNQMILPQFGVHSLVRVCDHCFASSQHVNNAIDVPDTAINEKSKVTASFASLDLDPDKNLLLSKERLHILPEAELVECTCGMPLCICKAQAAPEVLSTSQPPATQTVAPSILKKTPPSSSWASVAPSNRKPSSSSSSSLPSLFFSTTQATNGGSQCVTKQYDTTGEGMREAIKNGDVESVKELLGKGIDPNHRDKQGMSLLHLASVFNLTEIAFLLMDAGARLDARNAQGETPVDCAQATLQYKMQQRLEFQKNS